MKKLACFLVGAVTLLSAASCNKDPKADEQGGKLSGTIQVESSDIKLESSSKQGDLNVYKVTADELSLVFVSEKAYLAAGDYSVAPAAADKALLGTSSYKGEKFSKGTVAVSLDVVEGKLNYSILGLVDLEGGAKVKMTLGGNLEFAGMDLEPKHYYGITPFEDASKGEQYKGFVLALSDLERNLKFYTYVLTGENSPVGTYSLSTDDTSVDGSWKFGEAMRGDFLDAGAFGFFPYGTYFLEGTTIWYVKTGTLTISEEFGMYHAELTGFTAEDKDKNAYTGEKNRSWKNAMLAPEEPVDPNPQPEGRTFQLENATCEYVVEHHDDTGINDYTFKISDADGNIVANALIWTKDDNYQGTFAFAESTAEGCFSQGLNFFGMELGTWFKEEGKTWYLKGGEMKVLEMAGYIILSISDAVVKDAEDNLSDVTSIILSMTITTPENPDLPAVVIQADGGTCTYSSKPNEAVEGITEHYLVFKDSEGNDLGQLLVWTADGGTYTGVFPYAAVTSITAGTFAGGIEFLGFPVGSYFIQEGAKYYLTAGTAMVGEEDGKIGLLLTDGQADNASSVNVVLTNMTKSE